MNHNLIFISRFRPGAAEFGKGTATDQGKNECVKIMKVTKTRIEYSQQKDNSIGKIYNFSETYYILIISSGDYQW